MVWLQAVAGIGQLEDPGCFDAWIRTIARRTVYRTTRRSRRERAAQLPASFCRVDGDPEPESWMIDIEDGTRALEALRTLPPRRRELIEARIIDEHDPTSIADRIGWSVGAVNVELTRARRALKAAFDRLPLLVPPALVDRWRRLRSELVAPAAEAVAVSAVAATLALGAQAQPDTAVSPAAVRADQSLTVAADRITSSLEATSEPESDLATSGPAHTTTPTATPGPSGANSQPADDAVLAPVDGAPGVHRHSGDFSDEPAPDASVHAGETEARVWAFDYVEEDRPDPAPRLRVDTDDVDDEIPAP